MDAWSREIVELHEYFEQLFLGHIDDLDRAERALDANFTMAGPQGTVTSRSQVLAQLDAGRNHASSLSISIESPRLLCETQEVLVAEYIEVHKVGADDTKDTTRRRSTVIFCVDPTGPNGLRWLRVHETYVED